MQLTSAPGHAKCVSEFCEKIGYPAPSIRSDGIVGLDAMDDETRRSVQVLLREELQETLDAMDKGDSYAFLDGLADLVFVAMGAAHKVGANFDVVMAAVCRSNATKTRGDAGRGLGRDAVKGPDFVPADVDKIPPHVLWSRPGDVMFACFDDASGAQVDAGPVDVPGVFLEAARLLQKKSQDYNSSGVQREDYFPFGALSYAHEINKKALRLRSLTGSGSAPNHESIRDSAVDLMNYSMFFVEFIDAGGDATLPGTTEELGLLEHSNVVGFEKVPVTPFTVEFAEISPADAELPAVLLKLRDLARTNGDAQLAAAAEELARVWGLAGRAAESAAPTGAPSAATPVAAAPVSATVADLESVLDRAVAGFTATQQALDGVVFSLERVEQKLGIDPPRSVVELRSTRVDGGD